MRSSSLIRPSSALHPPLPAHPTQPFLPSPIHQQSYTFSTALNSPQTLTATRILPYHASSLFHLIADIPSYPTFLPYCTSSTITSYSAPDTLSKNRWPRTADLRVGWGFHHEAFRSRVFCKPYTVLEAVAGSAKSSLGRDAIPHYYGASSSGGEVEGSGAGDAEAEENPLFTSLLTRWTLREFPFKSLPTDGKAIHDAGREEESAPRTEVKLVIEVQFASAMYAALSQAAAPKVAGMMVGAFEKRAREVLGEGQAPGREAIERKRGEGSALEGVVAEGERP